MDLKLILRSHQHTYDFRSQQDHKRTVKGEMGFRIVQWIKHLLGSLMSFRGGINGEMIEQIPQSPLTSAQMLYVHIHSNVLLINDFLNHETGIW